ncbi:hypothetical protein ACHAXA_010409 [Cyclostephanos tholiformis]|uniref:Nuclear pore complex protein Nup85 n=1 Tax=Cyclostephanos tholiformis TaxID=382380 RepID=A0ABD3SFU0_9STRA
MDGALSSDRYNPQYRGGGGGGGNNHYRDGGGGGRGGGGRGRYVGGSGGNRHHGGGRHHHHHHPYHRRDERDGGGGGGGGGGGTAGRGGGGGYRGGGRGGGGRYPHGGGGRGGPTTQRHPANRFTTETRSVDPHRAMMRQLTAMVAKMGDLCGAAEVATAITTSSPHDDAGGEHDRDDGGGGGGGGMTMRPVVKAIGTNTPSYAALTLGVDVSAPAETHAGFAGRCVLLGLRLLGRDIDVALECRCIAGSSSRGTRDYGDVGGDDRTMSVEERVAQMKSNEDRRCAAELLGGAGSGMRVDAYHRAKLLLRYFAHLMTIGIVDVDEFVGLLELLVECASAATSASTRGGGGGGGGEIRGDDDMDVTKARALARAGRLLASLVLSVVPYAMPHGVVIGGDGRVLRRLADVVDTIDANVVGRGSGYESEALTIKVPPVSSEGGGGMEAEEEGEHRPAARLCMTYMGEPLSLDLIGGDERRCMSIPYLLSIENNRGGGEDVEIHCGSLDGIVFGRLAIFDAPPNPDEDGEDEDETKGEDGGVREEANRNHESYVNTYSLIDRFFLSDAVRDVLLSHRPMVSEAGADRNTAKEVAEQVWAVSHLFKPPPPFSGTANIYESASPPNTKQDASNGIEYGIIETLLSLVVQATPTNSSTSSASPLHNHLYLSRIILELTKLQPSLVPQAIVLAVSGMFNDFVPSLTPSARENLGYWFGFHLVNTGYQWPKAYWDHWAPYTACDTFGGKYHGRNSRGEFIKVVLHSMASMSSEGQLSVAKECLPPGSALVRSVLLCNHGSEEICLMEKDLVNRIWNMAEDPESIRQYLISDEVSESHHVLGLEKLENSMHHKSVWWRARLAVRALFHPAKRDRLRMARITENAWKEQRSRIDDGNGDIAIEGMMDEDVEETEDLLADLSDAVPRFKPVILAALARDADAYDSLSVGKLDDDELLLAGEISILEELGDILPYWDLTMANALLECLMKCKIVSGMAVAKWALAENNIDTHWWKFVSLVFRNSICDACSRFRAGKTDLGGGIGMIIDDGVHDEDPLEIAALRLEEGLKSIVPIMKFVNERACQVLAACSADKKVPLACADVADGMKRLLHALLFHVHSLILLTPSSSDEISGILTLSNVQKGFSSMDADGKKLALVCQRALDSCEGEQGKSLLHCLSFALEKLF